MSDKKSWWKSKMLWTNFIGAAAMFVQTYTGFAIPAEYQAIALAGINAVLRLITKQSLE